MDYPKRTKSTKKILQLKTKQQTQKEQETILKLGGAGDGIRARDLWTKGVWPVCSPDYESGALARLGYPGKKGFRIFLMPMASFKFILGCGIEDWGE